MTTRRGKMNTAHRTAIVTNLWSEVLNLIYPTKCPLCSMLADQSPCETCRGEMLPNAPIAEFEKKDDLEFRASLYAYEGRGSQAVRRLKYARSTSLYRFMSEEIARGVADLAFVGEVVPVPIHWSRLCSRGFNQAELLCAAVPHRTDLLKRIRRTRPQVGLNREQRTRNLEGAFAASPEVKGKSILLIDDVVTSGQTARECAKALKEQGAKDVGVLAFCGESGWD